MEINVTEKFQNLKRAPIVEAVINVRARSQEVLEEKAVRAFLDIELPSYEYLDSQRGMRLHIEPGKPEKQEVTDLGWNAMRFQSLDKRRIIKFGQDGISFSHLAPYSNWLDFSTEGLNLWGKLKGFAKFPNIDRLGLRYVNRFQLPGETQVISDYFVSVPSVPNGVNLPFRGFMHHDVFGVPGHNFAINLIKTIQPPANGAGLGLILDIDVFTTEGASMDDSGLSEALSKMRWLKNKVFFGSISEKAKNLCL